MWGLAGSLSLNVVGSFVITKLLLNKPSEGGIVPTTVIPDSPNPKPMPPIPSNGEILEKKPIKVSYRNKERRRKELWQACIDLERQGEVLNATNIRAIAGGSTSLAREVLDSYIAKTKTQEYIWGQE